MTLLEDRLAALGVRVPDLLLPTPEVDLHRWAVIACDQYTSRPRYWKEVDELVGDAPSTLRLTYPEVYLDDPDRQHRVDAINSAMRDYLQRGLLREHKNCMVLVRRDTSVGSRWGLLVALDLDAYSWDSGDRTLIRATEGTVLDRLPPRVAVRRDAELELPHILVLIDDPARTVIEPLAARTETLPTLYDLDLMMGGGHVRGWAVSDAASLTHVCDALEAIHSALDPADPLLFAMGDGNHSFATAKQTWNELKPTLPEADRRNHPARFALVELTNIYDEAMVFEPIHRVLVGLTRDTFENELAQHCDSYTRSEATGLDPLLAQLTTPDQGDASTQLFGLRDRDGYALYTLTHPSGSIPAATVQSVINALVENGSCTVDYIHGAQAAADLVAGQDTLAIFLTAVPKESFFSTIHADGALPRKTFSLGEADDKRFYLEARRITR